MSKEEQPKHVDGAYSWIFTEGGEESVFIGLPPEDYVKEERILGEQKWQALCSGMLAVISGKIDPGENGIQTIQREAFEEQALVLALTAISNTFPEVTVEQRSKGKLAVIHGSGHKFRITEAQLNQVRERRSVAVVSHGTLPQFLEDNRTILRPFVYVAAQRILAEGLLFQGGN